jgi:hypothetical protein
MRVITQKATDLPDQHNANIEKNRPPERVQSWGHSGAQQRRLQPAHDDHGSHRIVEHCQRLPCNLPGHAKWRSRIAGEFQRGIAQLPTYGILKEGSAFAQGVQQSLPAYRQSADSSAPIELSFLSKAGTDFEFEIAKAMSISLR